MLRQFTRSLNTARITKGNLTTFKHASAVDVSCQQLNRKLGPMCLISNVETIGCPIKKLPPMQFYQNFYNQWHFCSQISHAHLKIFIAKFETLVDKNVIILCILRN